MTFLLALASAFLVAVGIGTLIGGIALLILIYDIVKGKGLK